MKWPIFHFSFSLSFFGFGCLSIRHSKDKQRRAWNTKQLFKIFAIECKMSECTAKIENLSKTSPRRTNVSNGFQKRKGHKSPATKKFSTIFQRIQSIILFIINYRFLLEKPILFQRALKWLKIVTVLRRI